MKLSRSTIKWVALALVCAGFSSNLLADTAKVVRIKGAARYSTGNNQWVTLRAGDILKPGAVVQTASESMVDLAIGGDAVETVKPTPVVRRYSPGMDPDTSENIVRLRENTVLALDKIFSQQTGADKVTDIQLDLRAGRITGNVKKLSAASRFEIKLPNGVAGIRGTWFDLDATGILKVYFGSITISWYNSKGELITETVNAGFKLDFDGIKKIITEIPKGDMPTTPPGAPPTKTTEIRNDGTTITITPVLGNQGNQGNQNQQGNNNNNGD